MNIDKKQTIDKSTDCFDRYIHVVENNKKASNYDFINFLF